MTEPSRRPLTDALIPELEKLWEDASGRAEYVEISMIALDARDLARELAEAKRALSDASGWIPCAVRNPKERGRYLVYHPSFPEQWRIVRYGTSTGWENGRNKLSAPKDRITHWMPLPEAPK
jgi:hypothetical protein